MKKTNAKRPLRIVLDELTSEFVDAVLAAARGALFDRDTARAIAPEPPARAGRRAPPRRQASRVRVSRPRRSRVDAPVAEAATDLLITDPQALLAALETASPAVARRELEPLRERERPVPELLEPVTMVVPVREPAPAFRAREGEQVLRSTGSNVVLRRRRA